MTPITYQIQLEVKDELVTDDVMIAYHKLLLEFVDKLYIHNIGYVRSQMYINDKSYDGEPL